LPLSEKIRVELFIPDLPDPVYGRLLIEQYAEGIRQAVQQALSSEEAILITVHPVYHVE
jgi:hypothetical protein